MEGERWELCNGHGVMVVGYFDIISLRGISPSIADMTVSDPNCAKA